MGNESLTKEIKTYLSDIGHGAVLIGVASVDRFTLAPRGHHPCDFVPEARSVLVIALPIVSGLMTLARVHGRFRSDRGGRHIRGPGRRGADLEPAHPDPLSSDAAVTR